MKKVKAHINKRWKCCVVLQAENIYHLGICVRKTNNMAMSDMESGEKETQEIYRPTGTFRQKLQVFGARRSRGFHWQILRTPNHFKPFDLWGNSAKSIGLVIILS